MKYNVIPWTKILQPESQTLVLNEIYLEQSQEADKPSRYQEHRYLEHLDQMK